MMKQEKKKRHSYGGVKISGATHEPRIKCIGRQEIDAEPDIPYVIAENPKLPHTQPCKKPVEQAPVSEDTAERIFITSSQEERYDM